MKKDPVKWPAHPTFEKHGVHGYQSYGECGIPSEKRFHMPDNGNGVYWYSFDTGLAHHAVVSSEHEFVRGSPLHKWLVNDLKSVDRSKTPWVFVYIHRPLYCSVAYSGDYYRSLLFRDELEQELADHHVDIVFAGHYHSYERTCPVFGDRCIESPSGKAMAPVHLMVGSGGYKVDDAGFYLSLARTGLPGARLRPCAHLQLDAPALRVRVECRAPSQGRNVDRVDTRLVQQSRAIPSRILPRAGYRWLRSYCHLSFTSELRRATAGNTPSTEQQIHAGISHTVHQIERKR